MAALLALVHPASAQSDVGSCATGGVVADAEDNPGLVSDCEALLASRDTLAGIASLNWSASLPIDRWERVRLAGSPLRVAEIDVSYLGLAGEIPEELADLSHLQVLHLYGNQLTGEIPADLGALASLRILSLSGNQLTGAIPNELGGLANLTALYLENNRLTGELPATLGGLTNLRQLYFHDNRLIGELPQELKGLTVLRSFFFYNNPRMCAPVDDAFQTWLQSIHVVLGSSCSSTDSPDDVAVLVGLFNALDGVNWKKNANWLSDLPIRQWHGITNDATGLVTGLYLGSNQLSGEIPAELGGLTNLRGLVLRDNQLTGEIPVKLGDLANLELLDLSNNQLTGEIPAELGRLANLRSLRLEDTHLTGEIPAELGKLSNLQSLRLIKNQLTGDIPVELVRLTKLREMDLWANQLTGEIPAELGMLSNLYSLSLGNNQLTGEIPPELGELAKLQSLHLLNNQLTGEIPTELGRLADIRYMDLRNNQLTGEVPAELGDLAKLRFLLLAGNRISGCIVQTLRTLTYLDLDLDLDALNLPYCDVLLSGLTISPGLLVPPFDSYHAEYTVAVGRSQITVSPSSDHGASVLFHDQDDVAIVDANDSSPGHQVDFSSELPAVMIRVVSGDGQATHTYTIADLGIRYDTDNDGAIERDEVIAAIRDYFNDVINREEVIGIINLYFSS